MLKRIAHLVYAIITTPLGHFFVDKAEVEEQKDSSYNVHFKRFNGESRGTINIDPNNDLIEEEGKDIKITKQSGEETNIHLF